MMSDDVTFADLRLPTDLVDALGGWAITGPRKLALLVAAAEENSAGDVLHSGLVPPDTLLVLLTDALYNHYVVAEVLRLHTSAVYRDEGRTYHLGLTASNFSLNSSATISEERAKAMLLKRHDFEVEFGFSLRHDAIVNPFAELQTELDSLAGRDRYVVAARFGLEGEPPATLEKIGQILGVTRQRAFTILERAIKRLQYPSLVRLLGRLHRFVEWYAGSLYASPADSLLAQKIEKDFPAAVRPVYRWLKLLAAIRLSDVKQWEEDEARRPVIPPSELLSVGQAATILKVHQNTMRRWANEGLLTVYRIGPGGHRRFLRSDVERLLHG